MMEVEHLDWIMWDESERDVIFEEDVHGSDDVKGVMEEEDKKCAVKDTADAREASVGTLILFAVVVAKTNVMGDVGMMGELFDSVGMESVDDTDDGAAEGTVAGASVVVICDVEKVVFVEKFEELMVLEVDVSECVTLSELITLPVLPTAVSVSRICIAGVLGDVPVGLLVGTTV